MDSAPTEPNVQDISQPANQPQAAAPPPPERQPPEAQSPWRTPLLLGAALSAAWLAACGFYVFQAAGWRNFLAVQPYEIGAALLGGFAPVVLGWLVLAYVTRARDLARLERIAAAGTPRTDALRDAAEALRRQAEALTNGSGDTEQRMRALLRDETARLERNYRATAVAVPRPAAPPEAMPEREPAAAGATAPSRSEIDLSEIFRRIWRRKEIVFATVAVVMAIAAGVLWSMTPLYTAQALLLVERSGPRIVELESVMASLPNDPQTVMNEIEIIRSPTVIANAASRVGLEKLPEFNPLLRQKGPVGQFLADHLGIGRLAPMAPEERRILEQVKVVETVAGRVEVGLRGQSRIVSVGFTASDPQLALRAANAVADAYLEEQLENKFDQTQRVSGWLEERIAALRERVETSERAVEQYRARSGLIEGRGGTLTSQEVADLNTQLISARAARTEIESRYNQVRRQLREPRGFESVPEVLASPLIQRLREQQIAIDRQITELGQTLGDRHPRMLSARAEKRDLEIQIEAEINKIVQSIESSLNSARAREGALQSGLDQLKGRVVESNRAEIELRALEREARANRTLLESFLTRFKAAGGPDDVAFQQPDARIISRGDIPTVPSFPKKVPILAVALMASLILGIMIAFLMEHFDRGFRSTEELEQAAGVPSLGLVPFVNRRMRSGLAPDRMVVDKASSAFAESIRSVFAGLALSRDGVPPKTLLITSAQSDEGKSTLALSIARMRASARQRVIIVDADIRAPSVHAAFDMPRAPGLTEVLTGVARVDEVLRVEEGTGLAIITAGGPAANPPDLLGAPQMEDLLATLSALYDLVVIDSPPVRAATDARILAGLAETTLFVVRWGKTRREAAQQALRQVMANARSVRTAVSMVDVKRHARYGFGDSGLYYGRDRKYYTG
ncbi:MAG: polysaccharide biosynthesis tyrosine autokinase [Rhodospirillaceae bacterium]